VRIVPAQWTIVTTNVSPETTRVFLDGAFVGMVEDFSGAEPLYLQDGDYKLEFRLDGFETRAVDVHAKAGAELKISESLKRMPGAKQYGSYDNPEPDGGVQHFWGKDGSGKSTSHPVNVQAGGQDWREEGPNPAQGGQTYLPQGEPPAPGEQIQVQGDPAPRSPEAGASKTRARLLFRIMPGDAAVYLNDHFVGTGEELSTLSRGLQVPPGQHAITVSRPGMTTEERTVVVGPGKSETVEISLEP
jgi:hypothetical protein